MARYLALIAAGALASLVGWGETTRGEVPTHPVPLPPAAPKPAVVLPSAPAVPPPAAVPVPEYLNRYGKLVSPGTEPSHPVRLTLPFPDVGEMRVPTADELTTRANLERLVQLPDAEIHRQLNDWPAFAKMSFGDQGALLGRIQQLKDRRLKLAQAKARELGLSTLTPAQLAQFEKDFWDRKIKLDGDLARQFGPVYRERSLKLDEELFRRYSTPAPRPIQQAEKSSSPGTSVAK